MLKYDLVNLNLNVFNRIKLKVGTESIKPLWVDIGMMDIEIADSVRKKTTKCESDFKCLTGDTSCVCEVTEGSKLATVKIRSKPNPSCVYSLSIDTLHYCLCPTRNAIYQKYHL